MNTTNKSTKPAQSYLTVAAAVPKLRIGDVKFNIDQILKVLKSADSNNAEVTLLPEMSLTGYSLQDIFYQTYLHKDINTGLKTLLLGSHQINSVIVVGAPLVWHGKLYNCAIVICKGKIFGVVPKSYIPNTNEFYEKRWFASGLQVKDKHITVAGKSVPFGTDLIFELGNASFGVEICEDVWAPVPPSTKIVLAGADVIFNLSASNEIVGKFEYRRQMISSYTAKLACGYVYASSGVMESTADIVMGGDAFIAETGHILASGKRFSRKNEILVGDIDIDHIKHDRRQNTTIECNEEELRRIFIRERMGSIGKLNRVIEPYPFVPKDKAKMDETIEEILNIQANGLATRMEKSGIDKLVLGLSGGLDSTLAALVALRALKLLDLSANNLYSISMPGSASSRRTKTNAKKIANALGFTYEEKSIIKLTETMLGTLEHKNEQDITYENIQARARTSILLNRANQLHALVVGTGDLSEITLGWCTFNGDHISHYNVNSSIPKTLVKHMVSWESQQNPHAKVRPILDDIVDTPISPELLSKKDDKISQKTENIIGPYALHDFFLYYFIRWGDDPAKILFLAKNAFSEIYNENEISIWLDVFLKRFYANQWKRNIMPDGPKVGTVSLSPRGDFRMSPDTFLPVKLTKDL